MNRCWKNLLFCGIIFAGSTLYGEEKKAPAKMVRPPEVVKAGLVKSVPVVRYRKYIAKISAVDDVSLVARVSGVILEQKFTNGAMIEKDQPLFMIEDTTYKVALDSAKARLEQSNAELLKAQAELIRLDAEYTFAKNNLERQKTLKGKNATSEISYDEAVRQEAVAGAAVKAMKASISAIKATISAAEAAVRDAENNFSYTIISSPISGKAGKAVCSPGNYVTPATGTLVNVVSMDKMYINFWISMNDYLSLFGGSFETLKKEAVTEIILADGSSFTGKSEVVFIDNRVDKDTDTIRVRLIVDNKDGQLLPDGLVTVRVSRRAGDKTAVPVSAILNNGQVSFVYVLDGANKAAVRPVKLGEVQGSIQVIENGLADGECVVFDGTHKVFPGSTVKPVIVPFSSPKPVENK
ncbi:MAG: efflux RND transporter periplasmic adaptor subunit [Lentisphaerae bacterium]|nr:efflux RND transporter periplasmic adaptor subunit [Lentisphaerota bacterium]